MELIDKLQNLKSSPLYSLMISMDIAEGYEK
jgi:hypothetical protein